MNGLLTQFHFLRPWWLVAIVPAVVVWLVLRRRRDPVRAYGKLIAPHLLRHLLGGGGWRSAFQPSLILLPLTVVAILALAGPSWRREPSPFAEEQAGLMIVLKVGPTMDAEDLQPSRLDRARHKLHDLLALREGASAGLIAYSGSAHLVMPLTKDARIVEQMAEALEPAIMPIEGDALADALALAKAQFERSGTIGSIVVITDSVSSSQLPSLQRYRKEDGPPIQVLAAVGNRQTAEHGGINEGARALGARVVLVSVDDSDVRRIHAGAESSLAAASAAQEGQRWRDSGYALVSVVAAGMLLLSRRGGGVRWE